MLFWGNAGRGRYDDKSSTRAILLPCPRREPSCRPAENEQLPRGSQIRGNSTWRNDLQKVGEISVQKAVKESNLPSLAGISGRRSPHLTEPGEPRRLPLLDSLSVRCLSSYLFFAHILVAITHTPRKDESECRVVRRFFFLSMKSGKEHRV